MLSFDVTHNILKLLNFIFIMCIKQQRRCVMAFSSQNVLPSCYLNANIVLHVEQSSLERERVSKYIFTIIV